MHVSVIIHNMIVHWHKYGMLDDEETELGDVLHSTQVMSEFDDSNSSQELRNSIVESLQPASQWITELIGVEESLKSIPNHCRLRSAL